MWASIAPLTGYLPNLLRVSYLNNGLSNIQTSQRSSQGPRSARRDVHEQPYPCDLGLSCLRVIHLWHSMSGLDFPITKWNGCILPHMGNGISNYLVLRGFIEMSATSPNIVLMRTIPSPRHSIAFRQMQFVRAAGVDLASPEPPFLRHEELSQMA